MSTSKSVEIQELEKLIDLHNRAYWERQDPLISDSDYDSLVQRLIKLDPDNQLLTKVHPAVVNESSSKIKHADPMLSLDKVYDPEELLDWCNKVARSENEVFLIQIKYDGCASDLTNSILSTRGDGHIGENITDKLSLIEVQLGPKTVPALQFKGSVRGEIVLRKSVFGKYRELLTKNDGSLYKNSRNACAGILNRDSCNNPLSKPFLTLVPFDNITWYKTLVQMRKFVGSSDWFALIQSIQDSDFPADGLVIKLKDSKYCEELGTTRHHKKSEIAFKFKNPSAKTILKDVIFSCGKGCITPVGYVEPVTIGGVTVSNVSLHNMKNIMDKDICIGDELLIERAGDVIPHVVAVTPGHNRIPVKIDVCPMCNGSVEYLEPEVVCTNNNCVGALLRKLCDSVVRLGIERLGRPTIKEMIEKLGVSNLIDIFNLTKDDLLTLPRFGNKKANNLLREIQKPMQEGVFEWQLLSALNLPGIGDALSQQITRVYSLPDLLDLTHSDDFIDKLVQLGGIQSNRASIIVKGIIENESYIRALLDLCKIKQESSKDVENLTRVCFTGKFPRKKSEYYRMLESRGFEIMTKVDKTLDILVVADMSKSSNKRKKAEKMKVTIMTINDLLDSLH